MVIKMNKKIHFKEFRMGDLFEYLPVKKAKKKDVRKVRSAEFCIPVVYAKFGDNGIMYWGRKNEFTTYKNVISIVYNGAIAAGKVYPQEQETGILAESYFIRVRNYKVPFLANIYMSAVIEKVIYPIYSREHLATWTDRVENETINLPVDSHGIPDFNYMKNYIAKLGQQRLAELDTYLKVTGLDDYELTVEDKKLLSLSRKSASNQDAAVATDQQDGQLRFKTFSLATSYYLRGKTYMVDSEGIFEIIPTKKKINANNVTFDGEYPYVARGENNNGIRGKINYDLSALNPGNTITFGQDTATLNYQPKPYFTGDKIQIFRLNNKYGNLNSRIAAYLISVVSKIFANYSWGQQSFAVDKIAYLKINLPITSTGLPDFAYMESYIKAMEKVVISGVVKYKDQQIEATRQLVDN